MTVQGSTRIISDAIRELTAASRNLRTLKAAIERVALSHLDLTEARVVEFSSDTALPLTAGYWLELGPAAAPASEEAIFYALMAGALLQQTLRWEAAASEFSAVLARLDQMNRDLDVAQRSDWIADERTRIAQDLHDRVAQTLFGVGLKADWLLTHLEKDEHLRPDLERVKQLAATGMRQVREAIFSLSSGPVDSAQFKTAVQGLVKELEVVGISAELRTWGALHSLPSEVTDALYQVIREALVNVRRHSGAFAVLVSVRTRADGVTVVVQDDGQGLPPGVLETYRDSGAHLGLRGMESRVTRLGGSFTLAPGDECGLVVTATIPLKGEQHGRPDSNSDRR